MAVNPLQLFPPRVGVYFQHSPLDSGLNLWLSLANRLCRLNTYPLTRHFYLVKEPERTCGGWDHVTEMSRPSWGPYINSPDAGWTWQHGPCGRPADPPPSWAQPQSLAHRLMSKYNGGCFRPLSLCVYCYTIDNRYKGLNKWGVITMTCETQTHTHKTKPLVYLPADLPAATWCFQALIHPLGAIAVSTSAWES